MSFFPLGWSLRREAHEIEATLRARRLAADLFANHQDPKLAAKATLSARAAYPWLSPSLTARMGAFGVDPASPEAAEIAGLAAARSARRGWTRLGQRRNAREVRNVVAPTPWRSLDRPPPPPRPGATLAEQPDMILGPARGADIGLGVPRGTDLSSSLQAERERLAFAFARVPSPGVLEGARPEALGFHPLADEGTIADVAEANVAFGAQSPFFEQAEGLREQLPSLDTTVRHLRRGGLTFRGVPLPGGEVSPAELEDVYLGPGGDQIRQMLEAKRSQLEGQYPELAGSEYPALPGGVTPSMRAVYDGIVAALDEVIGPARESVGPDLSVAGVDLNVSDLWNVPYDAGKGVVRTATMAMDSLWQGGQAAFRGGLDAGGSPMTAGTAAPGYVPQFNDPSPGVPGQETDFGIVLERLAQGRDVEVGEGFMVGRDSPVADLRRERERRHGLIGGHVITMGRWAADTAGLEPDSLPFTVVSGAVDLGWMLVEPGGALVDVAARSGALRRALATAGGFAETRSVHPGRFDEWVRGRHGQAVLQHYADLDSPVEIARSYEAMSRRGGAARMPEWAHYLLADGEVGDVAYVEEMLRGLTGMGYHSPGVAVRGLDAPPGMRAMVAPGVAWRRRLARSRLAQETPETGARALDIYDADGFVSGLRDSLRNARVDEETIASLTYRALTEGYVAPSRVRVQQLERELAALPPSGPVLRGGTTVDSAVVRSELEDTLAELRPGLFVSRATPRRGVLFGVWRDAQDAKRARLVRSGVDPTRADELTLLDEVGRRVDEAIVDDLQREGAYWRRTTTDSAPGASVNRRVWPMLGGEHTTDLSRPGFAHMAAEHLSRYLPLEDDYRQLARLTRNLPQKVANLWLSSPKSGRLFAPWRGLDEVFMNRIWKPSRLLRPAWPLRVVGEEQFRMGAAGLDSAVAHPLSYIALVMGYRREGRTHRALEALGAGTQGRHATDALGTPWEAVAEHTAALNRAQRTWMIPTGGGSGGRFDPYAYYRFGDGSFTTGYAEAWTDLLARAHSDDLMRRIAQTELGMTSDAGYATIDDLIEAGGGTARTADEIRTAADQNIVAMTRADLMDSHPVLGQRGDRTYAARYGADDADEMVRNWDDYVESLQVRLFEITGRDPDLMHAVARGRFPDGLRLDTPNTTRINRRAARRLERNHGEVAPPVIGGDRGFHDGGLGRATTDGYDRALERMYSMLGATPTDRLARSPAFRQFYARRMTELVPYMNADAQARFLANAEDLMRLPAGDGFHLRLSAWIDEAEEMKAPSVAQIRRASSRGKGEMDLEMADDLAKHAALDNVRWLLYDVHRRGQFMDAMRVVAPFAEAWKEVATRWLQLTAARPGTVLQRSTQIVGATGSPQEWEDVVENPDGAGHIFQNATGEVVFTYPSEWVTSGVTGVPMRLTGAFSGLTIMSSVLPGVGPVVQTPLAMSGTFRDSPEWEGVRNALFPFGLGEDPTENFSDWAVDTLFSPAWQRIIQGAVTAHRGDWRSEDDRLLLNSAFDVARYLVSTGEYSTSSEREVNRLLRASVEKAGLLYVIRGVAGLALPSAPIPEALVESEDGSLLMLRALSDRYQQLQQEDYTTAAQRFLDLFGDNLSLVLQGKTVPRTATLPVTAEADRWVQSNPGVMDDYPLTFGVFAPGNTGDADFDFEAYNRYVRDRALQTLGRELTLRDLVYLANDRTASQLYRQREAEMLELDEWTTDSGNLTEEAQRHLSTEVTPWLQERFPGFGSDGLERGPSSDDLRDVLGRPGQENTELRRAVDDERIAEPIRSALGQYIQRSDEILETIADNPDEWGGSSTYFESTTTRVFRDHLRGEVIPFLREEMPRRYRAQWDVIVERVLDRTMLPSWLEEAEDEMAVAA